MLFEICFDGTVKNRAKYFCLCARTANSFAPLSTKLINIIHDGTKSELHSNNFAYDISQFLIWTYSGEITRKVFNHVLPLVTYSYFTHVCVWATVQVRFLVFEYMQVLPASWRYNLSSVLTLAWVQRETI